MEREGERSGEAGELRERREERRGGAATLSVRTYS